MTQEQKELLLKDLCARLPYKPIVQIDDCGIWSLRGVDHDDSAELRDRVIVWHGENYPSSKNSFPIINCKPYLFPLSSMTEEQMEELCILCDWHDGKNDAKSILVLYQEQFVMNADVIDWLHKNHFDYRGLIEKNLANDATNLNIY